MNRHYHLFQKNHWNLTFPQFLMTQKIHLFLMNLMNPKYH
jgi:hypothetical protein